MSLRDELNMCRAQYGRLSKPTFVDFARPEDSPSHGRFEWDDAVAAEKHRLEQAGKLIASVRVVYKEPTEDAGPETVRAFHAVRSNKGHVYEPAENVAADPVLKEMVLRDMRRDWESLRRRYARFTEFVAMVQACLAEDVAS
jgi:hypothetical protein